MSQGFTLVRGASWLDKVLHHRGGWVFLGWGHRVGWRGELPLYTKGNVVDYPHGYDERLG